MPLTTTLLLSGLLVPGFPGCEDEPDPARVPELIRLLDSKVINVPAEAAQELGQIGPEAKSAIPHLVPLFGDRSVYRDFPDPATVNFEVEWALVHIGVEAVPALTDALKSENNEVVIRAARALGAIGPRAKIALPALRAPVYRIDSRTTRASLDMARGRVGGWSDDARYHPVCERWALHRHHDSPARSPALRRRVAGRTPSLRHCRSAEAR